MEKEGGGGGVQSVNDNDMLTNIYIEIKMERNNAGSWRVQGVD